MRAYYKKQGGRIGNCHTLMHRNKFKNQVSGIKEAKTEDIKVPSVASGIRSSFSSVSLC